MERFQRIVPLLKRNDPIINSLNMCTIQMTDDMIDILIEALNSNSFISKIVLFDNALTEKSAIKIFNLLLTNPKLTHLEISNNKLSDESIIELSKTLKKLPPNRDPISVCLRKNDFSLMGAEALAGALRSNVPVYWLDLRDNPQIGDRGIESIACSLTSNTNLTGLDVIKCGCNELGAAALADSLLDNHTLKTLLIQDELNFNAINSLGRLFEAPTCSLQALYLWHCSLTAKLLEELCMSLRMNCSLTTLALSYNKIDDKGAIYLADMIFKNKSLLKLQLGANLFSTHTAGYFGVALSKNATLQFLDLSRNNLRSYGVWPIAVSLMNNKTLKTIDLRYNSIDSSGAEILCELIAKNTSITVMRLSGNTFDSNSIKMIAEKLKVNKTLKDLELNEVSMTSDGFVALCNALIINNTLEHISLSKNFFTSDSAMKSFSKLLKTNKTLQVIGMSSCMISDEGCKYIAEGIAGNSTLLELDISKNNISIEGARMILEALQGNYSLMKLDQNENPFYGDNNAADDGEPGLDEILNRSTDYLERNNYYQHNILMKDMSAMAKDTVFFNM
ncbi:Leucine Rich Repeat family protein [Histomonas meleagridis]|uniref:Leucine Rich Repeat family protein n=1 Tax=Histomonas meleagridis TaxID=135588 RepID=UPI00355A714F|nr:Leucine Rich Repeat family protein [Histomonas meleagridis]KAH0803823.1 Leucine Rich Repeat family protein [Histomonas meleagridis]